MRRALLAAIALLLLAAPGAHAANRFTLDAHASKPGRVLMNPPGFPLGSALVAWTSGDNDTPMVCWFRVDTGCRDPKTLDLPAGGGIDGLFPVVVRNTVELVGPRDQHRDVVRWTSDDGFATSTVIGGSYPALTGTQDVLAQGTDTWIAAANPGLGIGGFGETHGQFEFADPGPSVKTSSLAFDAQGKPVDAYYTLGGSLRMTRFTGDARFDEGNWTEPETIAPGTEPVLTGGPSGLFLASQDGKQLDLRQDDGTSFGAPRTLATDPDAEDFDGGAATQSPNGRIAVVWPAHRGDGTKVLRAYTSADGDSFAQSDIATIGDGYLVDRNASIGLADDGTGVVTFLDQGGLEVADTTPLAAPAPPPPPPRCVNATATAHLLGATLILRTTHVHAGDILAQVSVRSRHRLKIRVRFRYDGRSAHARTRLSALLHARPGTHHTLVARVYARGRTRTLRLSVTGCAG
jgi:hypothetical protein